ncbi:SLC13 family permease [Inhella sp.]|uniref:SLC13 family permease n=1 Tax=Inhella sp. TaxID=1921806 RepID=UPI0035B49617
MVPALSADTGIAIVFAVVYAGMFLGGLPKLRLDRSGVALLGAIAVIPMLGESVPDIARQAIDLPTLVLLFAFMVLSAQMQLGGFYGAVLWRVSAWPLSPRALLAALIAVAALLAAVFSNDVVCLALTPLGLRLARVRGLPPLPMLVALACAANIGSAATLIGNPQNMLIGATLRLDFATYLHNALPAVGASLLLLWAWLARGLPAQAQKASVPVDVESPPVDRWQCAKGLIVALALMAVFLFTRWPHEVAALVGAGVLLLSRRLHSREVMAYVDWPLLLLFIGLFVVNHAFQQTGLPAQAVAWLQGQGWALTDLAVLAPLTVGLSNLVSNVPAVMLLLPHLDAAQGTLLALLSTLAGNLLLVGSIANLIVADLAAKQGVSMGWRDHLRLAAPVAVGSVVFALLLRP